MNYLAPLAPILIWLVPIVATLATTAFGLWLINRSWQHQADSRLKRQTSFMLLAILTIIVLVLALPFERETQGQLLSLFGLVLTAVVALASSNFASNAMAGLMLGAVGSFKTGDFIRVDSHFGRVTEKSLLHTEIQTEDRDLITLPNLYLITHPIRVVRGSGTLISCDVSLGYDVHRRQITDLLRAAATKAELADRFVQITALGDFAVSYRVSGFLEDVRSLVSKRTGLHAKVLDTLHQAGVEIVSPNFMNQRPVAPDQPIMPTRYYGSLTEDNMAAAEELMFDKAELAARMAKLREQREHLTNELAELKDAAGDDMEINWRTKQLEALDELLATHASETAADD